MPSTPTKADTTDTPKDSGSALEELLTTSSDSKHATKKPDPDVEETNPPDGPHIVEERGKPS
jgi:hypothetical protein